MRTALDTVVGALTVDEVAAATSGTVRVPAPGRASGVSIDSRTLRPGELFVAIAGPRFDGHDFLGAAAAAGAWGALVHRDVSVPAGLGLVRVADTTVALGELARHVRRAVDLPVVAITGSAGKTTTKELLAALLATRGPVLKTEGNLNNQYGLPLNLLRLRPEHTSAVLELGMSAPGEIRVLTKIAEPDVAVITNVGRAHLAFFASEDAIAEAKAEILEGIRPGGIAVLNGDDRRVRRAGEAWGGRVLWFGRDRRYDVSAENWRGTLFGMRFDLRVGAEAVEVALPLPGPHHVMNFLAAAGAAHALGIPPHAMADAAARVEATPHRGQVARLRDGITLLDECYNSSPEALEAAIVALGLAGGRRRVAVLGDMLELGARGPAIHRDVGARLPGRVDLLAAVGPLGEEIAAGARGAGLPSASVHTFADAATAAAVLPDLVAAGDAILVKGSRGVRLEAVVSALTERLGAGEQ
jgi:UDP-N-acetylmuramoyl-tripeptide--D-alanyl-D-alanine ligase